MLAAAVSAAVLAPARFPPRAGWRTGAGRVLPCPGTSPQRCRSVGSWAATVPWRDCVECLPHRTVASLPADGIVIQISVADEHPAVLRDEGWPPRIVRSMIGAGFEGLPSRVGTYQHVARVHGFEVLVFVVFGRSRPSSE